MRISSFGLPRGAGTIPDAARRRAGSVLSPRGFPRIGLSRVRSETALAQPIILALKLLQPFHLLDLQSAKRLPPPIIADLAHVDLADRLPRGLALRDRHIDVSQLGDDLFRLVSFLGVSVRLAGILGSPLPLSNSVWHTEQGRRRNSAQPRIVGSLRRRGPTK